MNNDKYEAVIGLEVHAQLLTKTKAFCGDSTEYGAVPNSQTSVISLGHPGTLPKHNVNAIEYAVKLGLALNSNIREWNQYARKNYFYADLPKGYQITQDKTPICTGGKVSIKSKNGETKEIGITRIHMEEDAGKSMHDQDLYDTLVDFNRAGIPLIEIVTEPDFRNEDEVYAYLTYIRKLVRYLDICDGNMEEGSLRCDANVSVRLKGAEKFGTKVEVKNMNSISNVKRAISFEIERQINMLENNETFYSETRSFDSVRGTTFSLRTKEAANDYRYFPEPDLPPLRITEDWKNNIRNSMPPLPEELYNKYVSDYKLSDYDANVLTDTKEIALFFEEIVNQNNNYKAAANWVMGPVKSYLNEQGISISEYPLDAKTISETIKLIDNGKINYSIATQKLIPELIKNNSQQPLETAERLSLILTDNSDEIEKLVEEILTKFPDKVEAYKNGKTNLLAMFMGEVMKASKGKADPKTTSTLLEKKLNN